MSTPRHRRDAHPSALERSQAECRPANHAALDDVVCPRCFPNLYAAEYAKHSKADAS